MCIIWIKYKVKQQLKLDIKKKKKEIHEMDSKAKEHNATAEIIPSS